MHVPKFQFGLRTSLMAVTCFAVAAWAWTVRHHGGWAAAGSLLLMPMSVGTGIGSLAGRPWQGTLVGLGLGLLFAIVLFFVLTICWLSGPSSSLFLG